MLSSNSTVTIYLKICYIYKYCKLEIDVRSSFPTQVSDCFTMKLFILFVWVALIPTFVTKKTYQLIIPRSQGNPRAKLLGTIDHPLDEFTLCHWSRYMNGNSWGTILSYSSTNVEFAILSQLLGDGQYYFRRKNLSSIFVSTGLKAANWIHVCVVGTTFLNENWSVFVNGVEAWTQKENKTEDPIPPNGVVVLGQNWREKSAVFTSTKFQGRIADVFMWDRILTPQEINAVFNCVNTEDANVINWNLHTWQLFDGVHLSYANLPCGKK